MASSNQTSSEYVNHHLLHLSNAGDMPVGLFALSIVNFDTLFWSLAMGLLTIFLFWLAARKATSGVPGRFQCAIEMLVEMVEDQSKNIVHGDRTFVAPLALTVFVWVFS